MDKKPNEIHENYDLHKINKHALKYATINSYTTINTAYNWPVFLVTSCLNIGYVSLYELIRIRN